jgi:hypothetical protein
VSKRKVSTCWRERFHKIAQQVFQNVATSATLLISLHIVFPYSEYLAYTSGCEKRRSDVQYRDSYTYISKISWRLTMQDSQPRPSRRGFFFGAAAAGAAAAAIVTLPGAPAPEAVLSEPKPAPEKGGGYSLTEHVKHYYKTTRI